MSYIQSNGDGDSELSRRERRKFEVHLRILEASVDLFEQHGIDATKVSDICERADVAHKTFFNHFATKRHLLREIAAHGIDNLLEQIEQARKQPASTRDRIHHFFESVAVHADAAGPMHGELLTEIVAVTHESGQEPGRARKLHGAFGAIIADGIALGDVSERHSAETLTEMLMGAYYVLMFNWANLDDYPLRERALDTARFLTDSITISTEKP